MKLFGTDGIRGKAGAAPLEPSTIARVGAALVRAQREQLPRGVRVLIGRDTRESGTWIEQALAGGLCAEGAVVTSGGIVPTPAIAYLTRAHQFDLGVVISASHNPYDDNGIKVFSTTGEKLAEATEAQVERAVADLSWTVPECGPPPVVRTDMSADYCRHLRSILNSAGPMTGSRIVLDCAHGATAPIAPAFFASLGFAVTTIGTSPSGRNINLQCGSTHLDGLCRQVVADGARLGIAFDGDGDRTLLVDNRGSVVDGDAILYIAAVHLKETGRLPGSAIVATVMSNVGLELALRQHGIGIIRCAVGDKYVMEEMTRHGLALGGEQSGHVIFADQLSTGDGMATALHVLQVISASGRELADLAAPMVAFPQVLVNVRVREKVDVMTIPGIAVIVERVQHALEGRGRLLVRYSGTEPLLRIMLEGPQRETIHGWADEIAGAVTEHLA